jgi:adenosylcobyric acid synthase
MPASGFKVAPFKAQNMSNNARVVADGEMGSAQYFQALAARCVPDVRMNPVLLKPESDTHSQVILLGERRDELSRIEWRERAAHLWPTIQSAASMSCARATTLLVIEGAGSPAEINLQRDRCRQHARRRGGRGGHAVICDIDRGGAFAHLYGTYQLLSAAHRALDSRLRAQQVSRRSGAAGAGPADAARHSPEFPRWRYCPCGASMVCRRKTA